MIENSRADLVLGAVVEAVRQFKSDIVVQCANGESYRAGAAVLALPLNLIKAVRFMPALPRRKAQAAALGHGGRAFKVWIKARGVAAGTIATGGGEGIEWAFAERETADGAVLIVGFGILDQRFDPASRHNVEQGLLRLFPEAEFLTWDWHDWVSDVHARGTWLSLPAGAAWIGEHGEWGPEGRLFFASADYSPGTPGWFESAIIAGEAAATGFVRMLS